MNESKITIILGKRGSGKTTLTKSLIEGYNKNIIIWDFIGEYKGAVIKTFDSFCWYISQRIIDEKRINIILRLPIEDFDAVCGVIYIIGKMLFVIEEIDSVSSAFYVPKGLGYLIRYGRHREVSMIATSRRPADVPRLLTSQANTLYCFRFIEPRDLDYLKQYANINIAELQGLNDYKYIKKEL